MTAESFAPCVTGLVPLYTARVSGLGARMVCGSGTPTAEHVSTCGNCKTATGREPKPGCVMRRRMLVDLVSNDGPQVVIQGPHPLTSRQGKFFDDLPSAVAWLSALGFKAVDTVVYSTHTVTTYERVD